MGFLRLTPYQIQPILPNRFLPRHSLSLESTRTWKLRGLDPNAIYHADFWSGLAARDYTGAELMDRGYTCTLKNTRNADIMVLTRK